MRYSTEIKNTSSFNPLIPFIISPSYEIISYSELQHQIQQLDQNLHNQTVDEKDLKNIGLALWKIANKFSNFSTFSNFHDLIIQSDDVAVQNLPWECLYHPKYGFLGKHPDFTLSRCLPNAPKTTLPINSNPLKILHFTAQPDDLKSTVFLEIEIEQDFLETALNPFIHAGQVYLHSPNDGRFSTLKNLLQKSWHIVILTGHNFSGKFPHFLFENDNGQSHAISAEILAQCFRNQQIQCLVLSTCESGKNQFNNNSLAIQCFQAGVPQVIGMRESVMDRASSVFVQAFCEAVAKKARIDVAVQQGRCAMTNLLKYNEKWYNSRTEPSLGQWSLPMLFSCAPWQVLCAEIPLSPLIKEEMGIQIKSSEIFIGRRRELRILTEKLSQGKIKRLLIHGETGIGKTAFAKQLVKNLSKLSYKTIVYNNKFENNLDNIFSTNDRKIIQRKLRQGKWLFLFDDRQYIQNSDNNLLIELTVQDFLNPPMSDNILIILTSRQPVSKLTNFYVYELVPPHFNDFCHYVRYLGLPYKILELRLIYHVLNGNFKGLQLLQTIQSVKTLKKQLAIVKRYLAAYSDESR